MSDLKEQLINLGASKKALRPHIRPVLATLEKSSSPSTWSAYRTEAMAAFAKDILALVQRGFPKVAEALGIEVYGYRMTGTFELTIEVTMVNLRVTINPQEESVWIIAGHSRKEEQITEPATSTLQQTAQAILDSLARL